MNDRSTARWFVYAVRGETLFAARVWGDELAPLIQQLRAQRYRRIYRRRTK